MPGIGEYNVPDGHRDPEELEECPHCGGPMASVCVDYDPETRKASWSLECFNPDCKEND